MEGKIECPRCNQEITFETKENEDDSIDVDCDKCGAAVCIFYSFHLDIDDVEISEVPSAEFDCTECSYTLELLDVQEEDGSEDVECDNCYAQLSVKWSNWGKNINVELIEPGPSEEEEEEEEEEIKEKDEEKGKEEEEKEEEEDDDNDEDDEDDF